MEYLAFVTFREEEKVFMHTWIFLATLVALHLTPVSDSVAGQSFELA